MTIIQHTNKEIEILNGAGIQAKGSTASNLEGLNPKELIEAAVGLCATLTARHILQRDAIEYNLEELTVTVQASKSEDIKNRLTNFDIQMQLPETLDEAYKKKLIKSVKKGCIIGNTIENGATVEFTEK